MSQSTGRCAHCGSPKPRLKKDTKRRTRATSSAAIQRQLLQAHIDQDPYCSARCCRLAHGLPANQTVDARRDNGQQAAALWRKRYPAKEAA